MELVDQCFKEVDENYDGEISLDEFKKGVLSHKLIVPQFVNLPY